MSDVVLDASAAVRLVLGQYEIPDRAFDVLANAERVLAPQLFFDEIANAFWKYIRAGSMSESAAVERLREAGALVSDPVDDREFAEEAMVSASRYGHPAYDALYAVVARRNSCPVLTVDRRLQALLSQMRVDHV
jgi:predicted nucleic acid-binding protein